MDQAQPRIPRIFHCYRCGSEFVSRQPDGPLRCGHCKSPYWNRPRGTIRLDPAREHRRGDIAELVEHFVRKHSSPGSARLEPTPDLMAWLEAHDWPGNARELENVIRRLIALRWKAQSAVQVAVRKGRLRRPNCCSVCRRVPGPSVRGIIGHHDDYRRPLTVRWLCPRCHSHWHAKHIALPYPKPTDGQEKERHARATQGNR